MSVRGPQRNLSSVLLKADASVLRRQSLEYKKVRYADPTGVCTDFIGSFGPALGRFMSNRRYVGPEGFSVIGGGIPGGNCAGKSLVDEQKTASNSNGRSTQLPTATNDHDYEKTKFERGTPVRGIWGFYKPAFVPMRHSTVEMNAQMFSGDPNLRPNERDWSAERWLKTAHAASYYNPTGSGTLPIDVLSDLPTYLSGIVPVLVGSSAEGVRKLPIDTQTWEVLVWGHWHSSQGLHDKGFVSVSAPLPHTGQLTRRGGTDVEEEFAPSQKKGVIPPRFLDEAEAIHRKLPPPVKLRVRSRLTSIGFYCGHPVAHALLTFRAPPRVAQGFSFRHLVSIMLNRNHSPVSIVGDLKTASRAQRAVGCPRVMLHRQSITVRHIPDFNRNLPEGGRMQKSFADRVVAALRSQENNDASDDNDETIDTDELQRLSTPWLFSNLMTSQAVTGDNLTAGGASLTARMDDAWRLPFYCDE